MVAMFWKLKVTNTYSRITRKSETFLLSIQTIVCGYTDKLVSLVRRASVVVIITGTATCMVALATMISFLTYPLSTCESPAQFIRCRLTNNGPM
jgi:hypothetical protein